ncbi:MAG: HEPN domain-containing protein [Nocardiopsaceae bacterium]|nr:HEPN domain-containing protein [Nocardiopsaceae bacterium]
MRWNQGRATIDKLIADGELQRVPPNREHADQLLVQARKDLASAGQLRDSNPKRAYESLYDAARMALTAVLENQGLRPTSRGGHIAPYSAVAAQLDPPMGTVLRPFDRMRRTRNRSEYPSFTTPEVTADNVLTDLPVATAVVETCENVLDEMSPF